MSELEALILLLLLILAMQSLTPRLAVKPPPHPHCAKNPADDFMHEKTKEPLKFARMNGKQELLLTIT